MREQKQTPCLSAVYPCFCLVPSPLGMGGQDGFISRFCDFVILQDSKEMKRKAVAESQQAVQGAGGGTANCRGGILG